MAGQTPQARWREANPIADWAHSAFKAAVRRGLIQRQPCEICGAVHGQDGTTVDGHHADYDRPMAVTWLCHRHHMQVHAVLRALKGSAASSVGRGVPSKNPAQGCPDPMPTFPHVPPIELSGR